MHPVQQVAHRPQSVLRDIEIHLLPGMKPQDKVLHAGQHGTFKIQFPDAMCLAVFDRPPNQEGIGAPVFTRRLQGRGDKYRFFGRSQESAPAMHYPALS